MILSVERSRSTKDCKEIIISIVATSRSEKIHRRDKILNFETLIADTKNHEPRSKFDHKKISSGASLQRNFRKTSPWQFHCNVTMSKPNVNA